MPRDFGFRSVAVSGSARAGILQTRLGALETPIFFPSARVAAAATMYPGQVASSGAHGVAASAFALAQTPGVATLRDMGGVGTFMGWRRLLVLEPGLRDMLAARESRVEVSEEGLAYRSPRDSMLTKLTPEGMVAWSSTMGADISVALAEPLAFPSSSAQAHRAAARTTRWFERALEASSEESVVFAPIQGGGRLEAMLACAEAMAEIETDGWALEGIGLGEDAEARAEAIAAVCAVAPEEAPRMALWAASPRDMARSVAAGVDILSSEAPVRMGLRGVVWTGFGRLDLAHPSCARDPRPIDEDIPCPPARDYSRAYLHHLITTKEPLGVMLATWSNMAFCRRLMEALRDAIRDDSLEAFVARFG